MLQSTDNANVDLGLILLENYKEEFENYFKMSLEKDKEMFNILKNDKYWHFKIPFDEIEDLNLSSKSLAEIPDTIALMPSLCTLRLSNNQLKTLSNELKALKKLKNLYLNYNDLSIFPTEIIALKLLEILDLSKNKFEGV